MLEPNTMLQNRYRVHRLIGRGGMGAVYQAIDTRLHCTVALKETLLTEPSQRRTFEREAQLLARLRHPALPKVSDHFVERDGQFLIMEFIPGNDLAAILGRNGGRFPDADALKWGLRWADQLLDILDYLHTQTPPIVHRDIKPQNLKLSSRGNIILLDFGLAKNGIAQMATLTAHKDVGSISVEGYTPNYAPLEQIRGGDPDPRSDLYSLGATLYHLLTGVRPPDALIRATALLNNQPDPLRPANEFNPHIPENVVAILHMAMASITAQRPPDAAFMRKALRQTGYPITPTEVTAYTGSHIHVAIPSVATQAHAQSDNGHNNVITNTTGASPIHPPISTGNSTSSRDKSSPNTIMSSSPVLAIAFNPNGQILAVGGEDRNIELWQTNQKRRLQTLEKHTDSVYSVAFSPDGRLLAAGSDDKTIRIWNLHDAGAETESKNLRHPAACVRFSPNGQMLAAGGWGNTINIWDISDDALTKKTTLNTSFVHSLAFSPDSDILAAGCYDGAVRLWRLSDNQLLRVIEAHHSFIFSVAFNPDGETIAVGGGNPTITIWRVDDGRLVDSLVGHTNFIRSLAYNPEGTLLASGGEDRTVRVWDPYNGSQTDVFQEHNNGITSVAFTPDGRILASGGRDNKIRFRQIV